MDRGNAHRPAAPEPAVDADTPGRKDRVRDRVWDALERAGEARFPFPPHDRVPNFAGADDAADRLAGTEEWRAASVVKANPDAPQLPVRRAALGAGKQVFVAVPRLRRERCFLHLDPATIDDIDAATTIGGIEDAGDPVRPGELPQVDCIVCGSVAVSTAGDRIGKGEGFSDIEFGLLAEAERVDATTTVATTVHPFQVFGRRLPSTATDVPLDLIVTPDQVRRPDRDDRPNGVDRGRLDDDRIAAMPALERAPPGNGP